MVRESVKSRQKGGLALRRHLDDSWATNPESMRTGCSNSMLHLTKGRTVVDFGSGDLQDSSVPHTSAYFVALEMSTVALKKAKRRLKPIKDKVDFVVADVTRAPLRPESVDTAISTWTLPFLGSKFYSGLSEMARVTKKRGAVAFTAMIMAPGEKFDSEFEPAKLKRGTLLKGVHYDELMLTLADIKAILAKLGLEDKHLEERVNEGNNHVHVEAKKLVRRR